MFKNRRGFTVIELLVLFGIVAVVVLFFLIVAALIKFIF